MYFELAVDGVEVAPFQKSSEHLREPTALWPFRRRLKRYYFTFF
jgi:hypothetical protein